MAYAPQTYRLIWNEAKGHFVNKANSGVNPPSGFVGEIPSLWQGNSFELLVDMYEYYNSTTDNKKHDYGAAGAAGTVAKLYIKRINEADDPTELSASTGILQTVGLGTEYYQAKYLVLKGQITAEYNGQQCTLFSDIIDSTTHERSWRQDLYVLDEDGNGAATLETGAIPVSYVDLTFADDGTTLTAYDGLVVYLCDTSGGTFTVTAAAANAKSTQWLKFIHITTDANRMDIVGTFNGLAGAFVGAGNGLDNQNTAEVFADGTSWYNLNFTVIIR